MALFLILLSGPIQFLALANLGGLNVKPIHICFLYILAFVTFDRRSEEYLARALREGWGFFGGFAAYLAMLLLSSFWAVDGGAAISKFVKFAIYFLICVFSVLVFARSSYTAVTRAVIWGTIGGVLAFAAAAYVALSAVGLNILLYVLDALNSANFIVFQFSFYIYLSQYFGADPTEVAGIRHATVNFLIFTFLLFMAAQPLMRSRGPEQRVLGVVAATMSLFIIILSFSRSSIAIVGVVVLFVWVFRLAQARWQLPARKAAFALISIIMIGATGVVVLLTNTALQDSLLKLGDVLTERFSKLSNDERFQIFEIAVQKLDLDPLLGFGGGARVATRADDFQIHNVFLNAWFETGVIGLVTSLVFFGTLFGAWIVNTLKFARQPEAWVLPYSPAWVMALPMLPIVNALQGGDGNFDLASFFCIAAYFGWLTANQAARERTARQGAQITDAG
jgi:O-antigen ligase